MGRINIPGGVGSNRSCLAIRLLGIFPGIRLDRLEIYDCNFTESPASFLGMSGWKEIHLVAPCAFNYLWLKEGERDRWYAALEDRESGHSVEMQVFIARLPERRDATRDPRKRILLYSAGGQRPPEAKVLDDDAYSSLRGRELRVIAKRSGRVPYAVDGSDLPTVLQPLVLNPERWKELEYYKGFW
jgi:hypothetical protein